jgi:Fic family protein
MTNIIEKQENGKKYYYLNLSYREGNKNKAFRKYLGENPVKKEAIPILELETFIYNFVIKRWGALLSETFSKYDKYHKNLPGLISEKNSRAFGIRFTHNTNKIEGSSLSEREVALIVEDNIVPMNSDANDVIEAKSHMKVYSDMLKTKEPLTQDLILRWHKELFSLTKANLAGEFRIAPVFISGSKFVPPGSRSEIDLLLDELMAWYKEAITKYNPVFVACIFHLRFVSIHPFEDGNGRITRLITNYILFQNAYPLFDLEAEYRKGYYHALERSNLESDESYFVNWFIKRYIANTTQTLKFLGQ